MGRVHTETASQNKGCHEWEVINFSQINTVKSLIKYRSEFDPNYQNKMFESKSIMKMNAVPQFSEIITDTYIDLENLIGKTKLTKNHLFIINKLMMGYSEQDIVDKTHWSIDNIKKVFHTACLKLVKQNNIDWNNWLETSGNVKIEDGVRYKQCSKCSEWLRANEDNFSPDNRNKDGLQSFCKNCDSYRKKST
jgi:hypothetical protein